MAPKRHRHTRGPAAGAKSACQHARRKQDCALRCAGQLEVRVASQHSQRSKDFGSVCVPFYLSIMLFILAVHSCACVYVYVRTVCVYVPPRSVFAAVTWASRMLSATPCGAH